MQKRIKTKNKKIVKANQAKCLPLLADLKPELKAAYLKDTPLNRVAHPAEVADAAVFLASNGFANNCVLNLDGGLSAV